MIISRQWLSELVNLDGIINQDLADKLTQSSCEVELIEEKNKALHSVVVAKVIAINPHPHSEKLRLVTVDVGNYKEQVVCGAQNFSLDNFVAYAPEGTVFDDGMVLSEKIIAGVASKGMLCSMKELGVGEDHSGIWILDNYITDKDSTLGTLITQVLGLYPDVLFHIDNKSITHRNDLWGMIGMAREVAAIMNRPFSHPYGDDWQSQQRNTLAKVALEPFKATIDTPYALSYALLQMDGVDGNAVSPLWMQYRLYLLGLRSINALVDISNYVMLELGIPNHIYDREQLNGSLLHVRELGSDQMFVTLDGLERSLLAGDVVISDEKEVQIIAGVMGGQSSMVRESSTKVVMEAAVWDAGTIRKTSLRLGLRTDSSARYEKSLDPHAIEITLLRMCSLIREFMPTAIASSPVLMARIPVPYEQKILIEGEWVRKRIGIDLDYAMMKDILEKLAFRAEVTQEGLIVIPPTFRATKGTLIKEDVLEEIVRVHGFDKIDPQAPLWPATPNKMADYVQVSRQIEDFLVLHTQASEVMTHPLVGVDLLKKAHWHEDNAALKMLNSTNVEHDRMRSSLVPSLLKALELNSRHYESFRLFELGRVQHADAQNFSREEKHLAVLFYHNSESPFLDLIDHCEALMRYLGRKATFHFDKDDAWLPPQWLGTHPYEHAVVAINGVQSGSINAIHPLLMKEYKVKGHASLLILDVTKIMECKEVQNFDYQSLSRYPTSRFDSTWILTKEHQIGEFMQVLKEENVTQYLQEYYIFDIYVPKELQERHVTIRTMFGAKDKTLDANEVKEAEESVMQAFKAKGYQLKQ